MHKLLKQWDTSLTRAQHQHLAANLARRSFLLDTLKVGGFAALAPGLMLQTACSDDMAQTQTHLARVEPWYTFAATQKHLFPNDGNGPDAHDIHATVYLKFVLEAADTDPEDRKFIVDGVDWLNRLAIARYSSVFANCDGPERESLLQEIATSEAGERWLSFLLTYILEALLSDPVYGGNPNETGWKWLQHIPGFPRPPLNKRYTELV